MPIVFARMMLQTSVRARVPRFGVYRFVAEYRIRNSGIRKADDETAEALIRNTYYVLLTRGMLGTYVYCEDEGLREYLKGMVLI